MRLILAALLLVGIASALPSDDLTYIAPPTVANLQHVNPAVAKGFDVQDGNLSAYRPWELANLGHYASYTRNEAQDKTDLTTSQQSVMSNVSSNATNETLVYL